MILVIETSALYKAYTKNEDAIFDYSNSSLKELQNFLKNADESVLKEISTTEFATWKELTDKMNADRKSFPNSFYLKEVKWYNG